jgi:hypothetical protein
MDLERRKRLQAEAQRRLRAARKVTLPSGLCDCCGKPFERLKPNKRFCGDQCRKKFHHDQKKASEKNG